MTGKIQWTGILNQVQVEDQNDKITAWMSRSRRRKNLG
jgi:hypothetical protein